MQMTFFSHSIEHHFRIFRCAFYSVRKNLKYFKAITWKYVGESRWGMWVWQLISNVTNISPLIPRIGRRIENCNQNKHSRENTIESCDISFHIHACMHSHNENWKWKLFAMSGQGGRGGGYEFPSIVFHPHTTPATSSGARKNILK